MAKDYAAISKKIVENIGGVENIASVTHCMTRLRFVVKDEGKINDAAVKVTDGVMGVVNQGGQYQIIIGNHVEEAYNEVLKMGDFGEASQVARGEKKEPLTLKKVGNNILDAIVGTMSPLIPAIIGGSMVKLLVMLLGMAGVLSADGETYKILNTIGDAAFYFLPVMVAASASKKFNTNMFIAIAIAGLMLHPDFRTMMEAVTVGDTAAHFLGIPVVGVKYTYTVIPALCMTWILSYIERAIDKITPAVTKNFLKPMLIFLIAAPIAIIVVGPVGIMIGEGISAFVYFVQAKLGFLAVGIMGALWPLLVITGMHRVFTPTILQTISETGMEGTVMPSEIGANLSLGGVSLAVAFKTKNSELRQTALAAASSALIAGTTEPALYGVAVRLKRPLIASLISVVIRIYEEMISRADRFGECVALLAMLLLGLRTSEAAGLSYGDIRQMDEELYAIERRYVEKQSSRDVQVGGKTSNSYRLLPLVKEFRDFLMERKKKALMYYI